MSKPKPVDHPLIGKYFLTFPDGVMSHQGHIIAEPNPGFYLVQYYEWIVGGYSDRELVEVSRMASDRWRFFYDIEDWRREGTMISAKSYRKLVAEELFL